MFSYIYEYAQLMRKSWISSISGGLSVVLLFVGLWINFKTEWQPAYWYAASVFAYIVCSFNLWLRERKDLEGVCAALEPKLELLFEKQPPYIEMTHYSRPGQRYQSYYEVVRVGVHNSSLNANLTGVSVCLEDFICGQRSVAGIPFRVRGQFNPPFHTSFSLAPGATELVDIAIRPIETKGHDPQWIMLCLTMPGTMDSMSSQTRHKLPIVVYAWGQEPVRKVFELFVDETKRLQLEDAETDFNLHLLDD